MEHLVAVYGSLLNGFWSHHLLGNSPFLGVGKTAPIWHMYSLGGFPGLVPTFQGEEISVEVYKVNDDVFSSLDRLEGYDHFYDRKQFDVHIQNNQDLNIEPCWIYFLPKKDRAQYEHLPLIKSGSWREWNDNSS